MLRIALITLALLWLSGCAAALIKLGGEKPHRIVYCNGHVRGFQPSTLTQDALVYCSNGTFERYQGDVEYR